MNRLTVLESNSSLAVRYVEDQTRHAREALKRLEKDVGRLESLVCPSTRVAQLAAPTDETVIRRVISNRLYTVEWL